jgi:hypothetical protein
MRPCCVHSLTGTACICPSPMLVPRQRRHAMVHATKGDHGPLSRGKGLFNQCMIIL